MAYDFYLSSDCGYYRAWIAATYCTVRNHSAKGQPHRLHDTRTSRTSLAGFDSTLQSNPTALATIDSTAPSWPCLCYLVWAYVDVTAVLNKNLQVKRCVRRIAISQQSGECKHDMSVATYRQPATLYNEIVEYIHRVHRLTNTHHRSNLTQTRQQSHEDYHKMMQT